MKKPAAELRNGYTTGSAASAAAVAAFLHSADPVELLLPGDKTLQIPIHSLTEHGASVIKDGGDDPDATTGSEVRVELLPFSGAPEDADYIEHADDLELTIRGGEGIGIVTRPGLAVPPGKYAITPAPRKMIAENLHRAGCSGRWLITISIPDGAETAKKTLNPVLGIVNGLSILGRTGIVRPYSNAAYAATIILQMKSAVASGKKTAAAVTGSRTADAVLRDFPELSEETVVRIADFIYCAVTAAKNAKLETLVIGCMPGKLFKYACGEHNTHAHKIKMNLTKLREFGAELPGIPLEKMDSMGELSASIEPEKYLEVLKTIYPYALKNLSQWAGGTKIVLALYDDSGRRIL